MDEQEEECVDIGHAYLDLQELLLTGNDVIERKIDSEGPLSLLCLTNYEDTLG